MALRRVITLRARGRIQQPPKGSPDMAVAIRSREARRAAGQFTWLHAFRHYAFNSIASDAHTGRGGGTRTPADAVLETAALAAELHLIRKPQKQKSRLGRSRAACRSGACRQSFKTSTSAPRRP